MERGSLKDFREFGVTFMGIVGLQMPCLISRAPPNSALASFQHLGFPFNLSISTINKHFSFSPENIEQGRYHTLVSNLFNHSGEQHLYSNMTILIPDGYYVHRRFGRRHLLAAFIGGGVAGNVSQFCYYLAQQVRWENILPSPRSWGLLGDMLAGRIEIWQKFAMGKIFSTWHGATPCIGASAAVSSIVAVETCANVASLYNRFTEFRMRQQVGILGPDWDTETLQQLIYEVCHLSVVTLIFIEDVRHLFDSASASKGFIGSLVAYSSDGIGHAAHIGGFLFGVFYYIYILSGYRRRNR